MAETAQLEPVLVIPEDIEHDAQTRMEAAQFIGVCLTHNEVELEEVVEQTEAAERLRPIESLYDALKFAAEGDRQARSMVSTNVATDVVERTMKTAHVSKVTLSADESGRIQQNRQSMESVQANSLRLTSDPRMLERTKAETLNSFRIADLHKQGILETHNVVVFSRAADNMSGLDMRRAGFFVETLSASIQVTSAVGDEITTESAFVAGRKAPNIKRHDAEAFVGVGNQLGVDLEGKDATELLATPLLVPKSRMPNGVIDLVKLYDEASGGSFFGESKPAQDYEEYLEVCREREVRFEPVVETITNKLIAEAPTITDRLHATERLHQLSQDHMVIQAAFDDDIDPRVFGPAAKYIEQARTFADQGNMNLALQNLLHGQRVAVSSSCPSALKAAMEQANGENGQEGDANKKVEDCDFVSKKCPVCKEGPAKTMVRNGTYYHVGKGCKA